MRGHAGEPSEFHAGSEFIGDVAAAERKHAASVIARWQAMQQSNAHAGHVHINGICPYGIQDPRRPAPALR